VLGQSWGTLTGLSGSDRIGASAFNKTDFFDNQYQEDHQGQSQNYPYADGNDFSGPRSLSSSYPDFLESVFYGMPSVKDIECRKLILCHGHQFVRHTPSIILNVYRFFT
jgi:hypothetical protein